jgi:hypothetical protein
MDGARLTGGIGAAVADASREAERLQDARSRLRRIRRLILVTDAMIEELEQENLRELELVPRRWRARLSALFASLPFSYRPSLDHLRRPTDVLDILYELQGRLFSLKRR